MSSSEPIGHRMQTAQSSGGLTSRAEAPQRLSLGRGHVGQPQGALVEVLVREEVGQAHGGRVVRDVRAELLEKHHMDTV